MLKKLDKSEYKNNTWSELLHLGCFIIANTMQKWYKIGAPKL
jgi:hypothetical protein